MNAAPTTVGRGALAKRVNGVADRVAAKAQSTKPCNEDSPHRTSTDCCLRIYKCSKQTCLTFTVARGAWDTCSDPDRCGRMSWLQRTREVESRTGLYLGCWVCARFGGRGNISECKCSWAQEVNVVRHSKSASHRVAVSR